MPAADDVTEVLHELDAVMRELDLQWYVFGAQAAIIWGKPRLTGDVDITIAIDRRKMRDFMTAMEQHGFDARWSDQEFIERSRVIPFQHRKNAVLLDVVLAGPGFEEEFMARALPVKMGGKLIPFISPEDLVITKILAGRSKDVDDARSVIRRHRKTLDVRRIRGILSLLEQALTQSDLLPLFEREWADSEPYAE